MHTPTPEHQAIAQKLGINLANIDWTVVANILQFVSTLLAQRPPVTTPTTS